MKDCNYKLEIKRKKDGSLIWEYKDMKKKEKFNTLASGHCYNFQIIFEALKNIH